MMPSDNVAGATIDQQTSSAHPRGLYTLFFTEMWERFSFYGMRALLVLFMVDAVRGGMGMDDRMAASIYGLYTAGVYLAALPGGWVADRLLGARQAVWYGGIIIALGHFSLAIPTTETFYLGLMLVVVGTGLLKPNISTIVGMLYPEGGARRDAGFTIFYMGINIGAAIGPLICSFLGEKVNWHYGFGAAGIGMVLGLIQYRLTAKHLGTAGEPPVTTAGANRRDWRVLYGAVVVIAAVTGLGLSRLITINPVALARSSTLVIVAIAVAYFIYAFLFAGLDRLEKRRLGVMAVLFVAAAMFWAGFEQAGSSLNIFAEQHTVRTVAGWVAPAGWFQMLNPVFLIALAPMVASVWVGLARRQLNPSLPVKFALGLLLLGLGFLVMAGAARWVVEGHQVWPTWLITTYLLHTLGELCLSPVGLSSVTKLAPARLVGQMMGLWFLATSLGNLIAGLVAGEVTGDAIGQMPLRFMQIVLTTCGTAVVLLLIAKPVKRLIGGIT
jgi:proton-dependent oligopeptide transporter, POT family